MRTYELPYGKTPLTFEAPDWLTLEQPEAHAVPAAAGEAELVRAAMEHPIGSPRLRELAVGKNKVVIIASDHTRPVPSKFLIPPMLEEIRTGNPEADITILIATGCHRETTVEELRDKFGDEIVEREKIIVHDCDSPDMADLGVLPSGGRLLINRLAAEADLLVAEGFVEPHFFAGFSGGRKSVLPGVASRETVLFNHNAAFIANPNARAGVLEGNPIHEDMVWAAETAKLKFILNVCLDPDKKIIHAVAGDLRQAHRAGCDFITAHSGIRALPADLVITGNGGYPLDQNLYQAVKGMSTAVPVLRPGGVLIMAAACSDGVGGDYFYRTFAENPDTKAVLEKILATSGSDTIIDQWQSQIFAQVLLHCRVILISTLDDATVQAMGLTPAKSMDEAFAIARTWLDMPVPRGLFLPDGVSVITAPLEN